MGCQSAVVRWGGFSTGALADDASSFFASFAEVRGRGGSRGGSGRASIIPIHSRTCIQQAVASHPHPQGHPSIVFREPLSKSTAAYRPGRRR
jgi:hypothetical protein